MQLLGLTLLEANSSCSAKNIGVRLMGGETLMALVKAR